MLTLPIYIGCNHSNDISSHSPDSSSQDTVAPIVVHYTVYITASELTVPQDDNKSEQEELTYEEAMEAAEAYAKSKNPFYGTTVLSGSRVNKK